MIVSLTSAFVALAIGLPIFALGCPDPAEAVRAMEQMMLLPDGYVTGNGLTVSAERRLLGNGVVPAQGALGIWRVVNPSE